MRKVGGLLAVSVLLLALAGCAEHLSDDQKVQLRAGTSPYPQDLLADLRVSE
ncbi:hypothetical protein M2428_000492 [Arthrobacter sp. ES3-54]|nr:hypothetical protein [Arthrobacter sp. ES3-54]